MSTKRPLSLSLPIGLFSTANMSRLLTVATPERLPRHLTLHRELLDMPIVTPETDGLNEDLYWEEE